MEWNAEEEEQEYGKNNVKGRFQKFGKRLGVISSIRGETRRKKNR